MNQTQNKRHHYTVTLEISNDEARARIDLREVEGAIQDAIADYHSLNTVRNKKNLVCTVYEDHMVMEIDSPLALDVPSKALAKFTRILLTKNTILNSAVNNGRIFRSVKSGVPESQYDNITAAETIVKVVNILLGEQNEKNILLARQIKEVVFGNL